VVALAAWRDGAEAKVGADLRVRPRAEVYH